MPALVAGIHVLKHTKTKTWMAGTSPAMTKKHFNVNQSALECTPRKSRNALR